MTFRDLLVQRRYQYGYSQRQLARIVGCHHCTITDIERGRIYAPNIDLAARIARALDIDLNVLKPLSPNTHR